MTRKGKQAGISCNIAAAVVNAILYAVVAVGGGRESPGPCATLLPFPAKPVSTPVAGGARTTTAPLPPVPSPGPCGTAGRRPLLILGRSRPCATAAVGGTTGQPSSRLEIGRQAGGGVRETRPVRRKNDL